MALWRLRKKRNAWLKEYTQKRWSRNPMERLYPDYFYFHFWNFPTPRFRKGCYICYKVHGTQNYSFLLQGVFENRFYPEKPCHVELCFIYWFEAQKRFLDKKLCPDENYCVTWYMSWSPCAACVDALVEFLEENKDVELSIFLARIYYSNDPEHRQGLRRLHEAGALLQIMSSDDFEYCWETLVYNWRTPFLPWDELDQHSKNLSDTLEDILQNPEN